MSDNGKLADELEAAIEIAEQVADSGDITVRETNAIYAVIAALRATLPEGLADAIKYVRGYVDTYIDDMESFDTVITAARSAQGMADELARVRGALNELVECKDLLMKIECAHSSFAATHWGNEYNRRLPLAWAAARAALSKEQKDA